MTQRSLSVAALSLLLAACSPVTGIDENTLSVTPSSQLKLDPARVTPRTESEYVMSLPSGARIDAESSERLKAWRGQGMQEVLILAPKRGGQWGDARKLALKRTLRGLGIESTAIRIDESEYLDADTYRVEFSYQSMTPPDCPNWKSNASQSFSNKPFSNLGCATSNNMGQQVMYPQDIVKGTGSVTPSAARNSMVFEQYNSNADFGETSSESASGNTGGDGASSSASGSGSTSSQGASASSQ